MPEKPQKRKPADFFIDPTKIGAPLRLVAFSKKHQASVQELQYIGLGRAGDLRRRFAPPIRRALLGIQAPYHAPFDGGAQLFQIAGAPALVGQSNFLKRHNLWGEPEFLTGVGSDTTAGFVSLQTRQAFF